MGILNKFFGGDQSIQTELDSKQFEQSTCDLDCGTCNFQYPKSVKVDQEGTLWNSTSAFDLHIVIPTNKTDWAHDALGDKSMPFSHKLNKWVDHHKSSLPLPQGTVKVNVSSLSSRHLEEDPDYVSGNKGDILILPQFIWVKGLDVNNLDVLLPILRNVIEASGKQQLELGVKQGGVLVEIDTNQSYMFLCSHRTRDKRCGVTAPIIKKEIDLYTRELGFYRDHGDERPGGIKVAFINHIGGHKFAANVIIYLKTSGKNIWLARIFPNNVKPMIDECVLNDGKIWVDHTRLIQKFKPIDW